jgi:glutamyl-tRNA synthetase
LKWMNGQYIKQLSDDRLVKHLSEFAPNIDKQLIVKLAPLAKERMKTLVEFINYAKPFSQFQNISLSESQKSNIQKLLLLFESLTDWKTQTLHDLCNKFVVENNLKLRDVFMDLRQAVTGEKVGLPLFETIEILGKSETLNRIKQTLSAHEHS